MVFIPEPTLFGAPPADATQLQSAAYYAHFAGHPIAAIVVLAALARGVKKGVVSHLMIAIGAALAGGAAFIGQNLYNNFIYRETARMAFETPLLLLTGAMLLASSGMMFAPGMRAKRGAWVRSVVPVLAGIGAALAAIGQLPAVNLGLPLGIAGGLLAAAAGGLLILDKTAAGENPQEHAATGFGAGLLLSGAMIAAGAAMNGPDSGADRAELAFAISEITFAVFTLIAVLSLQGSAKDFAAKPRDTHAAPGYIPPPPGYVPPPPPSAPRGPAAPRAPQKRP